MQAAEGGAALKLEQAWTVTPGGRVVGRRGLPAQCRQLETHYALTADCGQTSYSLCYCLFVSFFLFFSLFLSLYTLKYIPLLCAACLFYVLFQPRFALPFVLALLLGPAFFYCFFLSAGVALCRSLSFFPFFHFFLFRKIHSWKEKRVKCEELGQLLVCQPTPAYIPLLPPLLLYCYPPTQKRFVVMSELSCTVSWMQCKSS